MSKKKMEKRIKKLETRVSELRKDLALFSARSEATASRTAFYEVELEKVKDLLSEAKGKVKKDNVLTSKGIDKGPGRDEVIEEIEKHIGREGIYYRGAFYCDNHILDHMGENVKLMIAFLKGEKVIFIFGKDKKLITIFPFQSTEN